MIYVTGDTHCPIDIRKLDRHRFPQQDKLTKADYVLVAGDFGLLWNYQETGIWVPACREDSCWTAEELYWLRWLSRRNFTTLFVDGNHENFDRLKKYPVSVWNGGKVQRISQSVIHLMRGQVYEIQGRRVFVFGGGRSVDRGEAVSAAQRDAHKWWWPDELPSEEELEEARRNLAANGNRVDVIVTHALPTGALQELDWNHPDRLTDFLEEIRQTVSFKRWYAGHYHFDGEVMPGIRELFQDIVEIED